jgi:hypothetical protein
MTSNNYLYRELNTLEIIFENGQKNGRFICPHAFIIQSQIDLYEYQNIVQRAILEWMKLHPLLNSNIITKNSKLFFKFNPEVTDSHLINVVFLNFCDFEKKTGDCWRSIHEFELSNRFNSSEELLWRIYFIKLSDIKYCILLNMNHATTDGKNSYAIIQELLKIIEDLYDSNNTIKKNEKEYEINYPNDPRFIKIPFDFFKETNEKKILKQLIIPEYLKDGRTVGNKNQQVTWNFQHKDFLDLRNKMPTWHEKTFGKVEYFEIPNDVYLKLVKKSKLMSVKLTSCFETLIALAWYRTIKKNSGAHDLNFNVKYSITVNTRPHLEKKLDYKTMGAWIAYYLSNLDFTSELAKEDFWQIARKKCVELHDFLNEKSFLNKENLLENYKFSLMLEDSIIIHDLLSHYSITNIGKLTDCHQDAKGKIIINQYYTSTSFTEKEIYNAAFHSICTINKTVYWSITYNSFYLKNEVILDWISLIHEIIHEIIT